MEAKGVEVLRSEEELEKLQGGTVIIRSHGVEKRIYDILDEKHVKIVDAPVPLSRRYTISCRSRTVRADTL